MNDSRNSLPPFLGGLLGILVLLHGPAFGAPSAQTGDMPPADTSAPRPNIVLIMADDLGEEILGAYGGESFDTPNIDALAESGTRFTHAFSTPVCSPSRTTILTGRYTFRYPHEWGHLPADEVTFGNVMRDAGYATAAAGKWQMGLLKNKPLQPRKEGFNRYSFWAWHEGPRYYDPLIWQNATLLDDTIDHRYGPDVYADFLLQHIKRNRGEHQRFFAYYPMNVPHLAKTDGPYEEPPGPDGDYQTYEELVTQMDRFVGRVVHALERYGLREETLILFTGDNGTPTNVTAKVSGDSVRGGKGKLTNAGTHVPLIASWPGHVPSGEVSDALIDFTDFLPTFADLAGVPVPQDRTIDGVSFVPQLLGRDTPHRSWVYTEWKGDRWARTRAWKLYGNGELHHVAEDPQEQRPIAPGEDNDQAAAARKKLRQAFEHLGVNKR
jgi:arylsulfatase A-like enzyme